MKILVTGGTGLLGSTLVPALRELGHEVTSLGNQSPGNLRCDLADPAAAGEVLDQVDPEAVLSLAALSNVDACERDPHAAWCANTRAVENLAAWLRPRAERVLVHLSTDQLYADPGPSPEGQVHISNSYGLSKYAGELAALAVGGTVLRTNFFGPSRRPGRLSQSDWFLRAFREQQAITLFEDIAFSPLSMASLSELIPRVLESPRPGVFNLGSRDGMSKAAFAQALAEKAGLDLGPACPGKAADHPVFSRRPRDTQMDVTRFEQTWGLTLPTLREELARLPLEIGPP